MLGGVWRHAAVGAILRLYPAVAIRNVEGVGVVRARHVVVAEVDGYWDFVLHVSVACR